MSRRSSGRSSAAQSWLLVAALVTLGCGGLTETTTQPGGPGGREISELSVQPTSLELAVGAIGQLTANAHTTKGMATPGYQWSSSNSAVATVSSTGSVRAISAGNASITVSAMGKSVVARVNVK